jgi:hypothetical protein
MAEVSMKLLLEYFSEVRKRTIAELEKSTDFDMATVYRPPSWWRASRDMTGAWVFGHAIVEESQHLGQIAFIRGMQRGLDG